MERTSGVPSLFSRVTRYRPTEGRDPREDTLTQCFAATLESAGDLAYRLAAEWSGPSGDAPASAAGIHGDRHVTPQRLLDTGDRIDLELAFITSERIEWLFWIEVKHQAGLSGGDQLLKYKCALEREEAANKRLVFLPPPGYVLAVGEHTPERLVETNWQRVGEAVKNWKGGQTDQRCRSTWIAGQFLKYLDEEGLFMSEPLAQKDLDLLERADYARRSFDDLVKEAGRQVDDWVERGSIPSSRESEWDAWPRRGPSWPEFWRHYGRSRDLLDGRAWLEWSFRTPEDRSICSGPIFGAGLTLDDAVPDDVWKQLPTKGLRRVPDEHSHNRVFEYCPIDDLIGGGHPNLSSQGSALASFAKSAFCDVLRALDLPAPEP